MYTNIFKISFSKLRKHEVKMLASRVITIVEGYNPETLKIKEIHDFLVELEPQIASLQLKHIAHPITKTLVAQRKQRKAFAKGIISQMETIESGKIVGKEEALEVAKPIVLHHLQSLWKCEEDRIYHNIDSLFSVLAKNEELQTALETLDLNSYFNSLRVVNNAIEQNYNTRRKDVSERPKSPTPRIVATLRIALFDLFKQIEVAQVKNQQLDYKPLIDDLNAEIAHYKAIIKTRASNSKKKAEGVIDDNEVVVENESEGNSESTVSAARMNPENVEVGKENPEQLDIEKTAAMPGKQTRLPIVSTEA